MITVHDIATATEIIIVSIRCQDIINIIINSLKRKTWTMFISLCRVVKYNIQDNFDSIFL